MAIDEGRLAARLELVERHIRAENEHDLDAIMRTFGEAPSFTLNRELHDGRDGVRCARDHSVLNPGDLDTQGDRLDR